MRSKVWTTQTQSASTQEDKKEPTRSKRSLDSGNTWNPLGLSDLFPFSFLFNLRSPCAGVLRAAGTRSVGRVNRPGSTSCFHTLGGSPRAKRSAGRRQWRQQRQLKLHRDSFSGQKHQRKCKKKNNKKLFSLHFQLRRKFNFSRKNWTLRFYEWNLFQSFFFSAWSFCAVAFFRFVRLVYFKEMSELWGSFRKSRSESGCAC